MLDEWWINFHVFNCSEPLCSVLYVICIFICTISRTRNTEHKTSGSGFRKLIPCKIVCSVPITYRFKILPHELNTKLYAKHSVGTVCTKFSNYVCQHRIDRMTLFRFLLQHYLLFYFKCKAFEFQMHRYLFKVLILFYYYNGIKCHASKI